MLIYLGVFLIAFFAVLTLRFFIQKEKFNSTDDEFHILPVVLFFSLFVGITSIILFALTAETWLLYLLIPEGILFLSGLMKDIKKMRTLTNILVQLAVFIFVYIFMNIRISSLKDPFYGQDVSLGLFSPLVTLTWMFIITNSLVTVEKIRSLLPGILLISSFVLLMTSSNVLSVSLFFTALFGIFTVAFIQSLKNNNKIIGGTSISQVIGFIFAILAIKGASLSATSVVLFVPVVFFLMLSLQKVYSLFKHDNEILSRTFLTPERVESKLISLGFTRKEFVLISFILTLLLSVFDIIFRHNPQLVAVAVYIIMIILILSVLRLFVFIRDYKDGDKRGKRIYVVNQYYGDGSAATGKVLKDLCEALAKKGYDVVVLTSKLLSSEPKFETINGVRVEKLCFIPQGNSLITKVRGYAKYFFLVWFRFFKVRRKSIILTLTTPPLVALVPVLWKPFKEFKVVYNVQDLYPDVFDVLQMMSKKSIVYRFLKRIEHSIFSKSDYVVPVGHDIKKRIMLDYDIKEEKTIVIQNGSLKEQREFSKKYWQNLRNLEIEKGKRNFVIQYAGNLGRVHEFQTVLGALKLINQKGIEDVEFQFIGGGYNYDKFKSIAKKQKIKHVEFLPYVSREEIVDHIAKSDVQLVISRKNLLDIGFPSKFYGAIAVGKPMIYICDGKDKITEYINKYKFGFVVPNGSSADLLEKILLLKKSPDILKKFSNNALLAHRKIDPENQSSKMYKALFDQLNSTEYMWKPISKIFDN
jgi:colanic acid biosynthesis glycosyl transferase WcaI